MTEKTEKVWVRGPAGAVVSLIIGSEIDRDYFDKRVAAGELTVVDDPEKPKRPTAKAEPKD